MTGLSAPKVTFGVHQLTAYNPETLVPYGTAKVLGSFSLNLAAEVIELQGGSLPFPWATETGPISTEGTLVLREFPDWLPAVCLGSAATSNAAEPSGAVTTLTAAFGTMVGTTGVASVGLKSGASADVKTGMYMVKVVSSTTVDVYAMSDVDFARGTDLIYQSDTLKITASPLTITASTAVTIPGTGLELTGGSGTIGMTIGHTAFFESRSINTGSTTATVGSSATSFVDVGLVCTAQKLGSDEIVYIDIFRAKAIGLPLNFTEKAFSESEVNLRAAYDSTRNGVFSMRRVNGTT